ncbi:MAG: hypothetical protein WC964_01790 [Acholeplasmataceae bacterium]
MKRRVIIVLSICLLVIILLPFVLAFLELKGQGIFLLSIITVLVYSGIYIFGGLAKLLIYLIYGISTALFLFLLPIDYQFPLIIIGTLLFVLNPLANFESFLEKKLAAEEVLPIRVSLYGSYWPFYTYRKEMKNFYHLPQTRKLYTKRSYLKFRQLTTIFLFASGIFMLIINMNSIANDINNFDWSNFFVFYNVLVIFVLTLIMYKKGFTSTFRGLILLLFPIFIYLLIVSNIAPVVKYTLLGLVILMGIVVLIYEVYKYYHRVSYDYYEYRDLDQRLDVYANALFEPLVYNESYSKVCSFKIKVKSQTFQKHFHDILVYANFFRFIITAYAYGREDVYLHADFHYRHEKRAYRFKTYLESKFKLAIQMTLDDDPNKLIYEKKFFHRPSYIIARALNLANLLKELEIESKIILSFIAYFETKEDLTRFQREYPVQILETLSEESYLTVRIDLPCLNVDYMIEEKIQTLLLSLLSYNGQYVRISVYY